MSVENARVPEVAPGHAITRIVDGSGFRTVNGIAFGPDGRLCAASMMGESVFALDLATGAIETVVGPFAGESDDLVFTPAGDLIWTAVPEGAVRMRTADGRIREIDLAGSAPSRLVTDHTGGLNAFRFGPDGMICAPSWNRGQVVCIDLESGHTTVLAEGFGRPGAVRLDSAGWPYVLDDMTGELFALDGRRDAWSRPLSPLGRSRRRRGRDRLRRRRCRERGLPHHR